ncbi:nitrogen regulatory protein P-II 1 [Methylomarinovum caldicuralii]|uniref:Nitrogen regulatory protein P-II 1 n=1 Tax=Methylomarinovum caldicuralii TaxID=438856 RepID=A0AAU9BXK8_9GAMM|nr:DUF3240 family protein [Methylomarinovum caldicuralii]BCX80980.1 nitrogen regulatory protein P-II 1 [Methylomarinovum caldicuralii]
MSELYQLTLVADPGLEEPVVDWLLEHEPRYGFTSSHLFGHSRALENLSLAEQVAGRKHQVRFQLCVDQARLDELLADLARHFGGSGIRYWVVPVMREGEV